MRTYIVYLLLITLLGLTVSASLAQQNQNVPKTDPEVEKLNKRISELEGKLQTVESVEKMELAAKLAEAQAKLNEVEFSKLKLELKESNQKWLIGWFFLFLTFIAAVGTPLWFLLKSGKNKIIENLKSNADQLIVDEVEKSLNGFKGAVEEVEILTQELRLLQKHYVLSVIEDIIRFSGDQTYNREKLRAAPEQTLRDVFCDKELLLSVRYIAAEILSSRQSTEFVSSAVEFLNAIVDSDLKTSLYYNPSSIFKQHLQEIVCFVGNIFTQGSYEGLKNFLTRLLEKNPKNKNLFLPWTVYSLAHLGIELDSIDSVDIPIEIISDLKEMDIILGEVELKTLAEYFDKFDEPEGIKDILKHLGSTNSDVKEKCLELLEKNHPEFVREKREEKASTNTEGEGTDESERPE